MTKLNLLHACIWAASLAIAGTATACPFCSSVSQTFSEEILSMDAVVVAKLVSAPPAQTTADQSVPKGKFQILQVIRGKEVVADLTAPIEAPFFGREKPGAKFLLMAVDPPKLEWSTPMPLSKPVEQYVAKIVGLPQTGPKRIRFFLDYLENKDEMLARDAYDEFAKAPYDDVKAIKSEMDHKQLVAWIQDTDIPASRRRLYFTMLGVCGNEKDLPLLESMLRSDDRKLKAGLDAMIACYLTLQGEKGVPLVEDLFLKNKAAEYADTYAAIMALRFHGGENDIVPRSRVVKALHHMLDRPQLADLVIPDLARWEDWSQVDKLMELFKSADEKSSWVKVPVINYLRACPKPEAKAGLEQLKVLDPAAVKRANTFFPYGPAKKSDTKKESSEVIPSNPMTPEIEPVQTLPLAAKEALGVKAKSELAARTTDRADLEPQTFEPTTPSYPATYPATEGIEVAYPGSPLLAQSTPNQWLVAAVSLAVGTGMLWVMWQILAGAGQRSPY